MNYKYIEQLLERYWECQTTLEEEAILRTFFAQADIPASLLPYRDLFQAEEELAQEHLSDDFDKRLMEQIDKEANESRRSTSVSHLRPLTPYQRLRPFLRAAAVVAVVLTIGMAAQQGFHNEADNPYPSATPLTAQDGEADTIRLFVDMPEPLENAEAVLNPQATDTIGIRPIIK